MPKIKIAIEVNVKHEAVQRWYTLEGQALLDAIKTAADSGDEVIIMDRTMTNEFTPLPDDWYDPDDDDDDDDLCYCGGDENGHDRDPSSIYHLNERILRRRWEHSEDE